MRHTDSLRRAAIIAVSMASWALLIASLFFWARTGWVSDVWSRAKAESGKFSTLGVTSANGSISIEHRRVDLRGLELQEDVGDLLPPRDPQPPTIVIPAGWTYSALSGGAFTFGNFAWESSDHSNSLRIRRLQIPCWFLALLGVPMTVYSALGFRNHFRRHRRRAAGLCLLCGYDLRGSPDRCPECGKLPEKTA